MRVFYDADCDLGLIKDKIVAVVGYGSQGHAHALNMRDSGVKNVWVALKPGSASAAKVEAEGLKVVTVVEAAQKANRKVVVGYILRHHPSWEKFVEFSFRRFARRRYK